MISKLFHKHQHKQQQHHHHQSPSSPSSPSSSCKGSVTPTDLDPRITLHYGIPPTASIISFDPIQRLLAIGTLDGRIKVLGGDHIEALLISPKQLPFKNLEFLYNQGYLASVSNENEIQIWGMEHRKITSSLQESNITSFSVIFGTCYMYIGDEYGTVSVLKYDPEEQLVKLPYYLPANVLVATGTSLPSNHSVVGVLPQPCSEGNRVLVAYENGRIVLWDISENRVVMVRGNKDICAKDEIVDSVSDDEQVEKEISSLCWASLDGSTLAVGYVDGDILLWNLSTSRAQKSANNAVKLQLSSKKRRLPVIVLRWSRDKSPNSFGGQLFVYGGDEVGADEVLTILKLDSSSGLDTLKCVGRTDLSLHGSFADLSVVPNAGAMESDGVASLCILTNPGQLHVYDDCYLTDLISEQEKKASPVAINYPVVIPTVEPYITVGKLGCIHRDEKLSRSLNEIVSAAKVQAVHSSSTVSAKWPITGGVPNHVSFAEDNVVERVYVAGYTDGTVRVWDTTHPSMFLIFVIESTVKGIEIHGSSAPVSALDFCSTTLSLAIGNKAGLVRLYKLDTSEEPSLHFVEETGHDVHNLDQGNGAKCAAVFSLIDSSVRAVQYTNFGARLAVGFECGRVAMFDTTSMSTLFLTDSVCGTSSPIVSLAMKPCTHVNKSISTEEPCETESSNDPGKSNIIILTKDAGVVIIDDATGDVIISSSLHPTNESIAISMHILEGDTSSFEIPSKNHSTDATHIFEASQDKSAQTTSPRGSDGLKAEHSKSEETASSGSGSDGHVLFCCEGALSLFSMTSLVQGERTPIQEVNLVKPCCWTTTFNKDDNVSGVIVVYPTGIIEIRSLPDLAVVSETSLMSILRWNFKTNMRNTFASSSNGKITMANGSEFAFISMLSSENDFRIPESLPNLHDKVLEAAAAAALRFSSSQNKKQDAPSGILGGIIKGLKAGKVEQNADVSDVGKTNYAHLEILFNRTPADPSSTGTKDDKVLELNIDDIEIDEPAETSSSSSKSQSRKEDKKTERDKLFEGAKTEEPRVRTPEEIMAKYKKPQDTAAAAAIAREKLVQRQEKLERMSQRTQELQDGAQNFAEVAKQIAKNMENRKWWQL